MEQQVKKYDWLIIGAGLAGSLFARIMTDRGDRCLVIDKRSHIGGNCYCENMDGVNVHKYGAHIFHTNSNIAWDIFKKYAGKIRRLGIYTVQAKTHGRIYPLPFNMNTFVSVWPDVHTPKEARERIAKEANGVKQMGDLKSRAISEVGATIYDLFIKSYTEKQWGRRCNELPGTIMKSIPVRFDFDNNYYKCDKIGIPTTGSYNGLFRNLLRGIEVRLECDFLTHPELEAISKRIFYTGPIDELMSFELGMLDYRSLRFELEKTNESQGCPVVNYCDDSERFTRRIEHNLFAQNVKESPRVITYEFPAKYPEEINEPYYPIQDERNTRLYQDYIKLARERYGDKIVFGGRLGGYKYMAMDETILDTLERIPKKAAQIIENKPKLMR